MSRCLLPLRYPRVLLPRVPVPSGDPLFLRKVYLHYLYPSLRLRNALLPPIRVLC